MDRQARKLGGVKEETSELGSEQGSNTDSENEDKVSKLFEAYSSVIKIFFNREKFFLLLLKCLLNK